MKFETLQKLDKLQEEIEVRAFDREKTAIDEWEDFDVIVRSQQDDRTRRWVRIPAQTFEFHQAEARRRAVVTRYARELSWLFEALRKIHPDEIERLSNHDFYAFLADAANLYIEENKGGLAASRLLEAVMGEVRRVYR